MAILVTGVAGFIGSHVAQRLLDRGERVIGIDNLNDYYDVALKKARLSRLQGRNAFTFLKLDLADRDRILTLAEEHPEIETICHLAAQAGVRHSLTHPFDYVDANVTGHLSMLELGRRLPRFKHMVYASSSSVYGANRKLPFAEADRVDEPVSLYAATKRAGELMAYCYAHLYGFPLTGLRFFTVYGPWGRPDMSAYLFTKAIFEGKPIRVFNHGQMQRDFTYIDDVAAGCVAAIDRPAPPNEAGVCHRVYNLGNHRCEPLMRFIEVVERACGRAAVKEMLEMQPGDVPATYADIEQAHTDLGFFPHVTIDEGIPRFVEWYRAYHGV